MTMNNKDVLTIEYLIEVIQNPPVTMKVPAQAKSHAFEFITAIIHYVSRTDPVHLEDFIRGEKSEVSKALQDFDEMVAATAKMYKKTADECMPSTSTKSTKNDAIKKKTNKGIAKIDSETEKDGKAQPHKSKNETGSKEAYKKGNVGPSLATLLSTATGTRKKENFVRFLSAIVVKLFDAKTFPTKRISASHRLNELGQYIVDNYHEWKSIAVNTGYFSQRIALKAAYMKYFSFAVPEEDGVCPVQDESDSEDFEAVVVSPSIPKMIDTENAMTYLPTQKQIDLKEQEMSAQNDLVAQLEYKLKKAKEILRTKVEELTTLKIRKENEKEEKKTIEILKESKKGQSTFEYAKSMVDVYARVQSIIEAEKLDCTPIQFLDKLSKINVTQVFVVEECLVNTGFNSCLYGTEGESVKTTENSITLHSNDEIQRMNINNDAVEVLNHEVVITEEAIRIENEDNNSQETIVDSEKDVAVADEDLIRETQSLVGKRSSSDDTEMEEIKRQRLEAAAAVENIANSLRIEQS